MANYPKELTDLLVEYLTDGIISAKERQVLLKKAEQLGVDTAEFDLYIDAQQQKVGQAVDAAAAKKRGKSCPFCGGTLPQLTDKCPHCGETVTPEASAELEEIFDHLEEALIDFKSGKDIAKNKAVVERYVRKAKMYYENNPKVQKLLAEVEAESENAAKIANRKSRNKTVVSSLKALGGVAVVVVVGLMWWLMWSGLFNFFTANDEAIDAQLNDLTAQIDALPSPNDDNYKEVEEALFKIHWKNIDDSKHNNLTSIEFLKRKMSMAERIQAVYKRLGNLDEAPEMIQYPDCYNPSFQ